MRFLSTYLMWFVVFVKSLILTRFTRLLNKTIFNFLHLLTVFLFRIDLLKINLSLSNWCIPRVEEINHMDAPVDHAELILK